MRLITSGDGKPERGFLANVFLVHFRRLSERGNLWYSILLNSVSLLSLAVSSPPTQGELVAVIAKLNELIAALLGISSAT